MSSIFNGSYSDSIQRVDSNSIKRNTIPTPESNTIGQIQGGEKFSNVLSNLQNEKAADTNARGSLGYQPLEVKQVKTGLAADDEISNLSFSESQSLIDGEAGQSLALNRKGLESYKISKSDLTLEKSSKIDADSARLNPDKKTLINQLPPAAQGRPPGAPKVLSAKMTGIEAPKPVLPAPIAMNEQLIEELIGAAGRFHGIDPNLSVAVARAESSLKTNAVSSDGHHSKGIFQLLDNTGKEMMSRLDVEGHYLPFDAKQNANLGVGYLRRLHDLFSKETSLGSNLKTVAVKSGADLEKFSVAAFNAGEGRVAKAQAAARSDGKNPASYAAIEPYLPLSTRAYVQRVSNLKSLADAKDDETTLA